MFNFFKKKKAAGEIIGAPVEGEAVVSAEISDPTFAEEMLGKGMAINLSEPSIKFANGNFEVDKDGLVWIHLHHRQNYEAWQRGEFHRVFLTKEEAIGYCEENNRAYSFLCDD